MKLPSQSLFLVLASAAVLVAGCSKKPARPDPSATVIGPVGGGSSSLTPQGVDTGALSGGDLAARTGDFDANGQNRTALAAQTVYFDFDKYDIKSGERAKLQAAKDYLDKNAGQRLLLEGHCDWRGTAEYNLALGDRRANAVKNYLQKLGVTPDRMETLSKGSLEATPNADDAGRAKDRRVDLVVVQAGATGIAPAGATAPGAMPAGAPAPKSGAL